MVKDADDISTPDLFDTPTRLGISMEPGMLFGMSLTKAMFITWCELPPEHRPPFWEWAYGRDHPDAKA